jgi:hypothetical protein
MRGAEEANHTAYALSYDPEMGRWSFRGAPKVVLTKPDAERVCSGSRIAARRNSSADKKTSPREKSRGKSLVVSLEGLSGRAADLPRFCPLTMEKMKRRVVDLAVSANRSLLREFPGNTERTGTFLEIRSRKLRVRSGLLDYHSVEVQHRDQPLAQVFRRRASIDSTGRASTNISAALR